MSTPKLGKSKKGNLMHFSVGAVIRKDGKYLLIDRVKTPFGLAGPAGHVDIDEEPERALLREIEEETGLKVTSKTLLFEEELDWNQCSKGVGIHHWYLYECEVSGSLNKNEQEAKSIDWYTVEEIRELELEQVWNYWFTKLDII